MKITCPVCKKEIFMNSIYPDHFTVRFCDNYVQTLIKQIGLKAAKKRLLEEGTVDLKLKIDELTEE
jgi:C4-type Zn-finger protein